MFLHAVLNHCVTVARESVKQMDPIELAVCEGKPVGCLQYLRAFQFQPQACN